MTLLTSKHFLLTNYLIKGLFCLFSPFLLSPEMDRCHGYNSSPASSPWVLAFLPDAVSECTWQLLCPGSKCMQHPLLVVVIVVVVSSIKVCSEPCGRTGSFKGTSLTEQASMLLWYVGTGSSTMQYLLVLLWKLEQTSQPFSNYFSFLNCLLYLYTILPAEKISAVWEDPWPWGSTSLVFSSASQKVKDGLRAHCLKSPVWL